MSERLMMLSDELVRCDIGNVVVSIFVHTAGEKALAEIPLLLRDFTTSRPPDTRLEIRVLETGRKISESRPAVCPPGDPPSRRYWHEKIVRHSGMAACLNLAGFRDKPDICIPLQAGILVAGVQQNRGILLANDPNQTDMDASCFFNTVLNALMGLISFFISNSEGALVHGTGLKLHGRGFLFVSPSGGGKTTLSKSSPPGTVLADDGILVRRVGQRWWMYPTPFRQRTAGDLLFQSWCRHAVPLKALMFLEKGAETKLLPVDRPEALGRLSSACTHFAGWFPAKTRLQLFDFWRELSLHVPLFRFPWQKNEDISKCFQRIG